jgi:HK97 family phage prohead protease
MRRTYDFAGWATKNDIRCSDGRTIRHGAFADQDGTTVPLVWMHNHSDVNEVLGHADLENRPEGVYAYCTFNGTEGANNAKELVKHGDVCALSIWANQLKQNGGDVIHGSIKEVSLVLAGANRGAIIDSVMMHGEMSDEEAEMRFVGFEDLELMHADDDEDEDDEEEEEVATKNQDQSQSSRTTVGDVYNAMTDEQKKVVAIIGEQMVKDALSNSDDEEDDEDEDEDYSDEGGNEMKHNVFEGSTAGSVLSHDDMKEIFSNAKKLGSLKAAVEESAEYGALAHADYEGVTSATGAQTYGFNDPDFLFPDAKVINSTPEFIKRETNWVDEVMAATHHTPFSRVKSVFADITEDEARAKGYIKGKLKKEEVFSLLKRTTEPQTIYKKQRLDKDDIDDITDFNVVAWLKAEMQLMLREETARAFLIGDGRLSSDDDKIKEDHIRPVYNDSDLFTVKVPVEIAADATDDAKAKALMKATIKARKLYKGSGNPTFFSTEDELTNMLLVENGIGERLYKSEAEVATAIRAKKITTVEVMEGLQIAISDGSSTTKYPVAGVMVNLADYNVGTNGGAKTDFFDDFDIDYNQYKYLYETRMSGALIKPFSAMTFYYKTV